MTDPYATPEGYSTPVDLQVAADLIVETDALDVAMLLLPMLQDGPRQDLASMLDLCPVHYCDVQICADDVRDCRSHLPA